LFAESARPRSTRRRSRRFFAGLDFMHEYSSRGELGCQRREILGCIVVVVKSEERFLHYAARRVHRK
jgi:hypothetical protein